MFISLQANHNFPPVWPNLPPLRNISLMYFFIFSVKNTKFPVKKLAALPTFSCHVHHTGRIAQEKSRTSLPVRGIEPWTFWLWVGCSNHWTTQTVHNIHSPSLVVMIGIQGGQNKHTRYEINNWCLIASLIHYIEMKGRGLCIVHWNMKQQLVLYC